jgi:hypothetical protein
MTLFISRRFNRHNIDRHIQPVTLTANQYSFGWPHIIVIAPPRNRNMCV